MQQPGIAPVQHVQFRKILVVDLNWENLNASRIVTWRDEPRVGMIYCLSNSFQTWWKFWSGFNPLQLPRNLPTLNVIQHGMESTGRPQDVPINTCNKIIFTLFKLNSKEKIEFLSIPALLDSKKEENLIQKAIFLINQLLFKSRKVI